MDACGVVYQNDTWFSGSGPSEGVGTWCGWEGPVFVYLKIFKNRFISKAEESGC